MMRGWGVVDLPFIHLIGSAAEVAASSRGECPASTVDRVASAEYFNVLDDHYGQLGKKSRL
jgi:hypothetical protein